MMPPAGRADGVNINITLMFSVPLYKQVARAYIRGLQRRLKEGQPLDIASVASFFVSRVDTAVDKLLEQKIIGGLSLGRFYPELADCMLFCATEMNRRNDMDAVAKAFKN